MFDFKHFIQEKTESLSALSNDFNSLRSTYSEALLQVSTLVEEKQLMENNFAKFQEVLLETEQESDKSLSLLQQVRLEMKSLQTNYARKQTQLEDLSNRSKVN